MKDLQSAIDNLAKGDDEATTQFATEFLSDPPSIARTFSQRPGELKNFLTTYVSSMDSRLATLESKTATLRSLHNIVSSQK